MRKWELGFIIALGILVSLCFYFPILASGDNLGIQDWDQNFAWSEASRTSIIEYHQFPLWNPYKCGGSVQFANPQIPVISLQTLFALLFGTVRGIKVSIFFHGLIGFIGFYLLAKNYKLSSLGSLLAAMLFSFSGITGSYLATGMVVFTTFAYVPYVLLCLNKSRQNWIWGVVGGALFAYMFYVGYQIPLILSVYLFVQVFITCLTSRSLQPLKALAVFIGIALLIVLPKLVMSIQLLRIYPRILHDVSGYSLHDFFYFLLSHKQNLFNFMDIRGFANADSYGVDENSIYVGILPVLFFVLYFIQRKKGIKENLPLALMLLVFSG